MANRSSDIPSSLSKKCSAFLTVSFLATPFMPSKYFTRIWNSSFGTLEEDESKKEPVWRDGGGRLEHILIRRWAKNSLTKGAEQYIISKMVKQSL